VNQTATADRQKSHVLAEFVIQSIALYYSHYVNGVIGQRQ